MSKHHLNRHLGTRLLLFAVVALTGGWLAAPVAAGDWNVVPSAFTHDPQSGLRTTQYAQPVPAVRPYAPPVIRSGYRQVRSSVQVGGVSDNSHYVERFGEPVQPYGEWRFPYRPYSTPYPNWGPPVPHTLFQGGGVGGRFGGGFGQGGFGQGGFGRGGGGRGYPGGYTDGGGMGSHPPRRGHAIDPRRLPVPATPDRWRPWHDGGYPDLPRDYYQTAPQPYRERPER